MECWVASWLISPRIDWIWMKQTHLAPTKTNTDVKEKNSITVFCFGKKLLHTFRTETCIYYNLCATGLLMDICWHQTLAGVTKRLEFHPESVCIISPSRLSWVLEPKRTKVLRNQEWFMFTKGKEKGFNSGCVIQFSYSTFGFKIIRPACISFRYIVMVLRKPGHYSKSRKVLQWEDQISTPL